MYSTTTEASLHDASQARELSRLLTAAFINQEFRKLLLTNPPIALRHGYNGESFNFTSDSQTLILSIHAASLEDFANQIILYRSNGNGSNGNGKPKKEPSEKKFNPKIRIGSFTNNKYRR